MKYRRGFTLIELMTVVAVVCLIASLLIPWYLKKEMAAKRDECHKNLRALYALEHRYFEAHQTYTDNLGALGWSPQGNLFRFLFSEPPLPNHFVFECTGNIDRDPTPEQAHIDETGQITQLIDDMRQ